LLQYQTETKTNPFTKRTQRSSGQWKRENYWQKEIALFCALTLEGREMTAQSLAGKDFHKNIKNDMPYTRFGPRVKLMGLQEQEGDTHYPKSIDTYCWNN
jgi:hypothetical protein